MAPIPIPALFTILFALSQDRTHNLQHMGVKVRCTPDPPEVARLDHAIAED